MLTGKPPKNDLLDLIRHLKKENRSLKKSLETTKLNNPPKKEILNSVREVLDSLVRQYECQGYELLIDSHGRVVSASENLIKKLRIGPENLIEKQYETLLDLSKRESCLINEYLSSGNDLTFEYGGKYIQAKIQPVYYGVSNIANKKIKFLAYTRVKATRISKRKPRESSLRQLLDCANNPGPLHLHFIKNGYTAEEISTYSGGDLALAKEYLESK